MKAFRVAALIPCMLVAGFEFLLAAPGDLDPAFGSAGLVGTRFGSDPSYPIGQAVAVQPDGKIVVAGVTLATDRGNPDDPFDDEPVEAGVIVRYNPDGSLDASFGGGDGIVITTPDFNEDGVSLGRWIPAAVAVMSDGRIVVAGGGSIGGAGFLNLGGIVIARYLADGRLDRSFGRFSLLQYDSAMDPVYPAYDDDWVQGASGMIVVANICDGVSGLAVLPDGKLIVTPPCEANIVRLNADGSPDRTFAGGSSRYDPLDIFSVQAGGLAIQADGRIVVAGWTALGDFTLARVTAGAQLDATFDGDGRVFTQVGVPGGEVDYRYRPVMVQPDGKIVVAGTVSADASFSRGLGLVRYSPDGALDPTFGIGGTVLSPFAGWTDWRGAVLQSDGRIVVAGLLVDAAGCERFALTRRNADGSLDDAFGVDGVVVTDFAPVAGGGCEAVVTALAIQPDQKIVAAGWAGNGSAQTQTTATYIAVARYTTGGAAAGNTGAGVAVAVDLGAVTLTFANVVQAGDTTATTSSTGPTPPDGFQLGTPPTYWDIQTTASFAGAVQVCIDYSGLVFENEASLRLFHLEGQTLVDRTDAGYPDVAANIICGTTLSLSPFVVLERAPTPTELIVRLIETIRGAPLAPFFKAKLIALLEYALASPHGVGALCGWLDIFIQVVDAGELRHYLSPETAAQLREDARIIQARLGCGSLSGSWHR